MRKWFAAAGSLLSVLIQSHGWAAGFLDHKDGTPYTWKIFPNPITYLVDQGGLGTISNAEATNIVDTAFTKWKNVTVATTDFVNGGSLSEDVNISNYLDYVTLDSSTGALRTPGNGQTAVIFDDTGEIFEALFGQTQGGKTLGFSSPGALDDNTMAITEGVALLNGKIASSTRTAATMTHEFGHMLNLAHVQFNMEEALDSDAGNDYVIPTMFPILVDDAAQFESLELDDQFSLAMLYPSAQFAQRGKITGRILRRDGSGVRAVNVICRKSDNPRAAAVSWLSDFFLTDQGEYTCGNLATGEYTVQIEPVMLAINFFQPDPPFVVTEFYSGSGESFDPSTDTKDSSSAVAVQEGSTTPDINVTLNEDGRLISGQTVDGKTALTYTGSGDQDDFYPELEYFITVPEGATSVKFELTTAESIDLDLFGRCDQEFSLPVDSTAAPLVSTSGETQQAEFAQQGGAGNETVELTANSSPPLKPCTYHLLVANFDADKTTNTFQLKATVNGVTPKFSIKNADTGVVTSGSGDITVMNRVLTAAGDTFRLRSLELTDNGTGDFSLLTGATLFEDSDGDGAIGSSDRLLSTAAAIDIVSRKISFSGMDEFFPPGATRTYLVSYNVSASAGWSLALSLLALGMFLGAIRRRLAPRLVLIAMVALIGLTCGSDKSGYRPRIQKKPDVGVTGQTFGTSIILDVEDVEPQSVKNFFE